MGMLADRAGDTTLDGESSLHSPGATVQQQKRQRKKTRPRKKRMGWACAVRRWRRT